MNRRETSPPTPSPARRGGFFYVPGLPICTSSCTNVDRNARRATGKLCHSSSIVLGVRRLLRTARSLVPVCWGFPDTTFVRVAWLHLRVTRVILRGADQRAQLAMVANAPFCEILPEPGG